MTVSSGYSNGLPPRRPMASTSVSGPTRPTNMQTTMISFPSPVNSAVMPVLSPTVQNALTTSNVIFSKP